MFKSNNVLPDKTRQPATWQIKTAYSFDTPLSFTITLFLQACYPKCTNDNPVFNYFEPNTEPYKLN